MRWLLCLFLVFSMLLMPITQAAESEEIEVVSLEIAQTAEANYILNARLDFTLGETLVDAVQRGIPLYFVAELQIEKPRWYWFNRKLVDKTLEYRLNYHVITRSYRLSVGGGLHRNFDSLHEALQAMQRLRNWPIAEAGTLEAGTEYTTSYRFRLDKGRLPKPFQVSVVGNREWSLDTGWVHWRFRAVQPDAEE